MFYDPNENLILQIPVPTEELEFSGERFTTAVQGEVRHEHLHRYLFALQFCRNKHVLDVASGEGYGAAQLSKIARSVTGIDVSQEAVTHARHNYPGAHYVAGLAESLPLSDASMDVVISFETIEHLVDHTAFLQEIKRVLKPDGILVMSSPDRDVYSGEQRINNPHHLKELTKAEFQTLMHKHFDHTCFFGQVSMAGSVVVPDQEEAGRLRVQGFRHQSGNFIEASPGVPGATYIISVATNGIMPEIFAGSFDDRPFQLGLYDELQQRHIRILQRESEIANLRNEVAASQSELEATQEHLRQSESQAAELSNAFADLSNTAEELRLAAASNFPTQDNQQQLEQLTAEIAAVREELAGKHTEIQNLIGAVGREAALVGALETQLAAERRVAMERAAEAERRAEAERSASSALSAKYMAARAQFDAVCASKSWQLSQPFRDLAAAKRSFSGRRHSMGLSLRIATAISSVRRSKTINLLRRGGLFDAAYYLEQNPDVAAKQVDPLLHYVERGAAEGRSPNPLFDTSYYLKQNPDVAQAGINPLAHYVQGGWREGREPHALFDTAYYLQLNPDVAQTGVNPLAHYLEAGWKERRNPHALFDVSYYLDKNPDVAQAGIDPLSHYLRYGWKEKRNPHALFNISYYLDQNPDVAQAGVEPLTHYLHHGWRTACNPHPLFDISYVLAVNPDLGTEVEPLTHYVRHGAMEGRNPHPLFHSRYYLEQNPDVAAAGINPLAHYCETGFREGRSPNPLFDSRYYLETNSDLDSGVNPLVHFITHGAAEGRCPHPLFDTAFYSKRNPDVISAGANPLAHFLSVGFAENRDPHPLFDLSFYIQHSPWISQAMHNPVIHYLAAGAHEGKDPHPHFDTNYYLDRYPDVRSAGINPLVHYVTYGRDHGYEPNPYYKTFLYPTANFDSPAPSTEAFQTEQQPLRRRPLISVVMPTYNSPIKYLELAIRSVQQQTYANWELCICDDGSPSEETLETLHKEASRDNRIRLKCNSKNGGISHATNQALALAQGEFIALMDHDDELTKDALSEIVSAINAHPEADVFYSDQDYINEDGSLHQQFFKPDWSPDLFRGVMYVGHLLVVRRTLALEAGGCNSRFDFVQDFEFMLRLSERTQKIVHVPRVLYHWRRIQGSVALHGDEKPGIESLQAGAVNAHFKRCGIPAIATSNPSHAHRLLIYPEPRKPTPAVMVLLDARRESPDATRSVASILDQTTYTSFDIGLIAAREGRSDATSLPFRIMGSTLSSALAKTDSEFVVIIRPVIEILSPNWLSHLLLYAEQPGIVCVGPLILQPDGNVSNAGLIVAGGSEVRMAMHGFSPNSDGYAGSLSCAREVAALDSSCVMVETRKLRQLTSLDEYETSFYQVIDLCMRAAQSGSRNICNPRAVVKNLRPTAPEDVPVFDRVLFQNLWAYEAPKNDPYYNPNFGNTDFGVAVVAR